MAGDCNVQSRLAYQRERERERERAQVAQSGGRESWHKDTLPRFCEQRG